mmetsp:Transcript_20762/g.49335  ORF Transcript_20762/g.49335 Transcript_20762/m.49335 type:complete len:204 (-) Transcript_20762:55-666(-)|eukprot:CAMPEP_0117049516 /NCGR_PEP_ID=MMETSP0472-20121206/34180_1 /TAXON_ID=693140 ORGANISM="Tiarina fusus, Strain LIS" /NCGR_SAMPLE_ID=MMETSP0472 /ASSEMBLY_ACC=CAM_ASM_000603 /LENGTH=203 /DNA_ID=CAMNT_0004762931 /DNA_START=48 /DNA_END=659 /DNA_ORIENTATION=+
MFENNYTVVDCRGHLLGRLCSIIAKELLCGQKVVLVRCEEINISGSFIRNKLLYMSQFRKRMNTNPQKGPIHYRAPSRIVWRTIRGMMPHKTDRGAHALENLKVFDGIPAPYDKMKRMVVPDALRITRLKPQRKYCVLGRVSQENGWKHLDVVKSLEEKRKIKSQAYYEKKKAINKKKAAALATAAGSAKVKKVAPILAAFGY